MVERAIPAVWELAPPAMALQARQDGAIAALRRLLAGLEKETVLAAERLGQVTSGLDCGGRVLAAANTALPEPGSALAEDDGRSPGCGRRPPSCVSIGAMGTSRP